MASRDETPMPTSPDPALLSINTATVRAQWRLPEGFAAALDDIFARPGSSWLRRFGRWLFGRN